MSASSVSLRKISSPTGLLIGHFCMSSVLMSPCHDSPGEGADYSGFNRGLPGRFDVFFYHINEEAPYRVGGT